MQATRFSKLKSVIQCFPFVPGQTSSVSELGLAEPVVDRSVGPIPMLASRPRKDLCV